MGTNTWINEYPTKLCTICKRKFYLPMSKGKYPKGNKCRPSHAVTCSKKCAMKNNIVCHAVYKKGYLLRPEVIKSRKEYGRKYYLEHKEKK